MAALIRDPSGAEYAHTELELQDRILSIYGDRENDEELFRPDLADTQKVGFFSLDRPSQTDVTEIVDLKEMTEVLQILLQDVATLRRDINFTKHVMQADYESKLQDKSLELYCRINERVTELEKMHEERVGTVRRAFRQQLSDAIARIAVLYNKNLDRKINAQKGKQAGDASELEIRVKELLTTIQHNESVIHMLKMQIQQLQNKEPSMTGSPSLMESERPSAVSPLTPGIQAVVKPKADDSLQSVTPAVNLEVLELRDELTAINKKVELLKESLDLKDDDTTRLSGELDNVTDQLLNERIEMEQLRMENQSMRMNNEKDKASSQQLDEDEIQKQKEEMERIMAEKLRKAKEESSAAAEVHALANQQTEKNRINLLMENEKLLKEQLAAERAKLAEALKGDTDVNRLRKNDQMLKEEIVRLKKEIERIIRTWEKKFAILQQSLHALKDESYIRQTLQRQAAALHHASVSYAADTPMGITPSNKHPSPTKRPLPDIPRFGKGTGVNPTPTGGVPEKEFISYTVSAPSGRGTALFSTDENQVMFDNEGDDIPTDIVPLPDKPARSPIAVNGQDGRRIVIIPTNTGQ